jgi:biotin carboxylase
VKESPVVPSRSVLLVGANDELVVKTAELGLPIILLQHPTKLTAEQQRLAGVIRVVDYTEWAQVEPVVRELYASPGFAAAVSVTEPGLDNAARINDLFGLGGTSLEVSRRFRDKLTMRRHLAGRDPLAVAAAPLHTRADLDAFGAAHGYPFIVKPTDATASIGVQRASGPDDLDRVWATVQSLRGTRTDRVSTLFVLQDFLMEEFVGGPEFSVESFSFDGRHVIIAITEKFTDPAHFAELGHAVPARLDQATQERIRASVSQFLDLMGYRDGPGHTEIRLDGLGPRIIEGHNRVAGDAITELVIGAYGIDLNKLSVAWPMRLCEALPDTPKPHAGACVRFMISDGGQVEAVEGVDAARRQAGVMDIRISAKPGDKVSALRDNWDRLALIAVTAADTDSAIEKAGQVLDEMVKIRLTGPDGRSHLARVAPVRQTATSERAGTARSAEPV